MMDRLNIKICGMKYPENVKQVAELGPDYIGFIFYNKSARYVGEHPDPEMFESVPERIKKVAVFVNESVERMIDITNRWQINVVQLHGNESIATCERLKTEGKVIIKAIPGEKSSVIAKAKIYAPYVDYFLFDTPTETYGGSGKKFDWRVLHGLEISVPLFLSGGLGPDDAEEIGRADLNNFHAIDLNSGFESSPGKKDTVMLKHFLKQLKDGK